MTGKHLTTNEIDTIIDQTKSVLKLSSLNIIIEQAKIDLRIDRTDLIAIDSNIPNVHAKYWEIYIKECQLLAFLKNLKTRINKSLLLYYRGKQTDEYVKRKGVFNLNIEAGSTKRIAREDVDLFVEDDEEFKHISILVDNQSRKVEYVKSLLGEIQFRQQKIKNIIDWSKLEMGG